MLSYAAAISNRLIFTALLVKMHESEHDHRYCNSFGPCSCCANDDSNDLKLGKCIRCDVNDIIKCKEAKQTTRQFNLFASIRKQQIDSSTMMFDTTAVSFSRHPNISTATQQATILSIAYLFNRSYQSAASIDVSTQQNSCGYDGFDCIMVQVQVVVLALVMMYAFACTFATTRYFSSTSFVIRFRSLKQHVNKKIFYRSHTRFKACSYSRKSWRIYLQHPNHFSLNLHFTRESENIPIRRITNIYSDQFRIYLKFRYKVLFEILEFL